MPTVSGDEERREPILILKIDVTASRNQLLSDVSMPILGRGPERRDPILVLKINVTASVNQLLRDGSMPICGSDEERRAPIPFLKINVTASVNQLLRDGSMPICGRAVERRCPTRVLGVDQGQRACRRQERPNSHCIAITGSIMNVEHSFAFFFRGLRAGAVSEGGDVCRGERTLSDLEQLCLSEQVQPCSDSLVLPWIKCQI
jgi:hypothetical protein